MIVGEVSLLLLAHEETAITDAAISYFRHIHPRLQSVPELVLQLGNQIGRFVDFHIGGHHQRRGH